MKGSSLGLGRPGSICIAGGLTHNQDAASRMAKYVSRRTAKKDSRQQTTIAVTGHYQIAAVFFRVADQSLASVLRFDEVRFCVHADCLQGGFQIEQLPKRIRRQRLPIARGFEANVLTIECVEAGPATERVDANSSCAVRRVARQ